MSDSDGISRLRKAADNQASLGEATFMLPIGEMLAMLDEIEDELAQLAWAEGAPAPRDADGEIVPRQVQMVKLNEPFETAYLDVGGSCDIKRIDPKLTAAEAREKASTEEGLLEVAEMRCGYFHEPCMRVATRLWPCQLRTGTQTFVLDLYDEGRGIVEARVHKDGEPVEAGHYFPAHRAEELHALGLELLKKNLLEYADELDAESAEKEDE